MNSLKIVGSILLASLIPIAILFYFSGIGIVHTRVMGVAQQNANTAIFENSQAYVQGKRSTLRQMVAEVKLAKTPDQREAAWAMLRQEVSSLPDDVIPDDVSQFLRTH